MEGEAAAKFVENFAAESLRRVPSFFPEFLREVGLVVIVPVEIFLEEVEGLSLCPFPIEFLKAENPCQYLRRKADVLLE